MTTVEYVLAALAMLVLCAAAFAIGRQWRDRGAEQPTRLDELSRRALEAVPAGHLVLGPEGELLLANESAQQLGIVTGDLVDPRIVKRAAAVAEKHAARRSPVDQPETWEITGEPGWPRVLNLTAQALGDDVVLVTATDETAARQAETVRRDFVANVSHELKSPVTAMSLLAEALAEAADDPETVRRFTDRMRRESTRLGTLITELIVLSAVQDGSLQETDLVPVDEVVGDAVDAVMVAAGAKSITVNADRPVDAVVTGDRSLLTTAIGNLVGNAVNYSEAGSTVTVSWVLRRNHIDIAVSDTGIGIAPQDQRRVFERFFRADPARSRSTGGTGLGLAIVKHVAMSHGGSVRLASRVGEGSTFTLRLPLASEPPASDPLAPTVDELSEVTEGAGKSA